VTEPRRTPLSEWHASHGARMVDFAGYLMPVQYEGVLAEHRLVRRAVGLFDISHMAEFHLSGVAARAFLDRLVTNNVGRLAPGRVLYTALCREDGGVLDDLLIYCLGEDRFLVVANAANRDKVGRWLQEHLPEGVSLRDASDETALIAIQGPDSLKLLQRWPRADGVGAELERLEYYHTLEPLLGGIDCVLSRTGYTGERGYELYLPAAEAVAVWEELLEAGASLGAAPVGLGARDTLRLEVCYSLYGHELDEEHTPLESNIAWVVRWKKAVDFIGKEALLRQKQEGVKRGIHGFQLEGRAIARAGATIHADGKEVGRVTSGTFSPTLERAVALARVENEAIGSDLEVEIRGRRHRLRPVEIPFVKPRVKD